MLAFFRPLAAVLAFAVLAAPATAADLSSYDKVYVAPVQVSLRSSVDERPVTSRDQSRNASRFREQLKRTLGDSYNLVGQPGPGVVTVQATITTLRSSRATQADITERPTIDAVRSIYAGGAEATISFYENGASLGGFTDSYYGSFNDGFVRAGIWSDAERAYMTLSRATLRYMRGN